MQVFYVGLEPTGDEPDETEYTGPVRTSALCTSIGSPCAQGAVCERQAGKLLEALPPCTF